MGTILVILLNLLYHVVMTMLIYKFNEYLGYAYLLYNVYNHYRMSMLVSMFSNFEK